MASSPPNSRRAQIKDNVRRQLLTITTDNDYSRTVKYVDFDVLTYEQLTAEETPAICIVPGPTTYKYGAGRNMEIDWKIDLYLTMKESNSLDIDEFISDIETCLAANNPLSFDDTGAVASYIRIREIITDGGFFLKDQIVLAKMTISVVYTKCYPAR